MSASFLWQVHSRKWIRQIKLRRLQNSDNFSKEGERLGEALKGTVIQARSFEFPQSANQGIQDFSKPAGLAFSNPQE